MSCEGQDLSSPTGKTGWRLFRDAYLLAALLLWAIFLGGICLMVYRAPDSHTVTPVYRWAVHAWFAQQPLRSVSWHYFPQFVFFFMPFYALPQPWCDIAWRVFSTVVFVAGLWRLLGLLPMKSTRSTRLFFYLTVIVLSQTLDALHNGQANLVFAGLCVHAAVSLAHSRWWAATLFLLAAVVAKPLGVAMVGLALLAYRPLFWRVIVGGAALLALPFFFHPFGYVYEQSVQSIRHLYDLSSTSENRFADINGLLQVLGLGLPGSASRLLRILASAVTAVLSVVGANRARSEAEKAIYILGLSTIFLVLFNPMTEKNSYVIVIPVVALVAILFLLSPRLRNWGWAVALVGGTMGAIPEIFRKQVPSLGLWWGPLVILAFAAVFFGEYFRSAFPCLKAPPSTSGVPIPLIPDSPPR
jgi:alpha-1,2-mannosyltransferase